MNPNKPVGDQTLRTESAAPKKKLVSRDVQPWPRLKIETATNPPPKPSAPAK